MVPPFFGQSKPCCLLGNELALTKRERERQRDALSLPRLGGFFMSQRTTVKKEKKKLQKIFFVGDDIDVSHVIHKYT